MSLDKNKVDAKLQQELMIEEQKAKFQLQVHHFTDVCWEKCIDKPSNKLDGRSETCLVNCVDRFIDTTMFITNRFAELLQKQACAADTLFLWNIDGRKSLGRLPHRLIYMCTVVNISTSKVSKILLECHSNPLGFHVWSI